MTPAVINSPMMLPSLPSPLSFPDLSIDYLSADQMEEAPPSRLAERLERVPHPLHAGATVLVAGGLVGPVHHQRAPFDLVYRQEAPVTAVLAVVPIVAQDEQLARGNDLGDPVVAAALDPEAELGVAGTQRGLQEVHVRLVEGLAVDVDDLLADLHLLAGQADDPLDEVSRGLFRVLEDHDVPTLDRLLGQDRVFARDERGRVDDLVDEQVVADQEVRLHGPGRDLE